MGGNIKSKECAEGLSYLRRFPIRDSEFVRFLKERGLYSEFIKCLYDNRSVTYQKETLENHSFKRRLFEDREYILMCIPILEFSNDFVNWRKVHIKWVDIVNGNNDARHG